jgi:hypothetical protein
MPDDCRGIYRFGRRAPHDQRARPGISPGPAAFRRAKSNTICWASEAPRSAHQKGSPHRALVRPHAAGGAHEASARARRGARSSATSCSTIPPSPRPSATPSISAEPSSASSTTAGRLPMTNNISERNLRKEAVGRKNWIFVGSEDGATANTTFVALIASCELHGLEPWRYLRDLFYLLPDSVSGRGCPNGYVLSDRSHPRRVRARERHIRPRPVPASVDLRCARGRL